MGKDEYKKMEDALGEDGVVNLVFDEIDRREKKKQGEIENWVLIFCAFVAVCAAIAMGIGGFKESGWLGMLGQGFAGLIFGFMYAAVFVGVIRNLGTVIATVLGTGACFFVIYILWKAMTYTAGGTVSWFKWLFGNF